MTDERPKMPGDLKADQIAAIKLGTITKVEQLGDEWRDDHIDCVALRVHVEGRRVPIDTSLWWCGPVIIGALRYVDESPRAMTDVLKQLRADLNSVD